MLLGAVRTPRLSARAGNELTDATCHCASRRAGRGDVDGRSNRPPVIADGDDTSNSLFCMVPAVSINAKRGCEAELYNKSGACHTSRAVRSMCRSRKARERVHSAKAGQGAGREARLQRARLQSGTAGRFCGVGAQREMLHGNMPEHEKSEHSLALCDESEYVNKHKLAGPYSECAAREEV